ncbi:hypothetical protein E2P81_ATG11217 [Venturia nashicola]|uniref:Uncharacterized protein n=1 Tax=Venturia nashicola TaxID=86259 RepID=A0A4Z1P3R8_9PEZI|nr:hypothetical protein E6O75_ATG10902 [Venturia nashicola]TLD35098.1 hypothetical protein E2P81_ATG11217 [Venturia nashicola]
MTNPEATPSLLGIPPELREFIFEYCLPFGKNLYKLPFEAHYATNGIASSRLHKVDISPLLTINKSIYFDVLPMFQKNNKFHVNRFDQLRSAVYGCETGLSAQFRHLTVHGDTHLSLRELRDYSIIDISEWENLRYLSLAADDFDDMFKTPTTTRLVERNRRLKKRHLHLVEEKIHFKERNPRFKEGNPRFKERNPRTLNSGGRSPLFTSVRRSDSSHQADMDKKMSQLINQLLSYNDGCLRIQGRTFFETFQVYGKKGQKTTLQVDKFIPELQEKCTTTARSGKCFQAPVEEMIGEVKVSIEFSSGGITTAKIL